MKIDVEDVGGMMTGRFERYGLFSIWLDLEFEVVIATGGVEKLYMEFIIEVPCRGTNEGWRHERISTLRP
jgi:hypothetical protein